MVQLLECIGIDWCAKNRSMSSLKQSLRGQPENRTTDELEARRTDLEL